MEAADEGRKAEDIPAKEIEDSLHKAEVRSSGEPMQAVLALTIAVVTVCRCSAGSDG